MQCEMADGGGVMDGIEVLCALRHVEKPAGDEVLPGQVFVCCSIRRRHLGVTQS